MIDLNEFINQDGFTKLVLSAIAAVASIIAKYIRDLSKTIQSMGKDLSSLNREIAIVVTKIESHEKRLDNLEVIVSDRPN